MQRALDSHDPLTFLPSWLSDTGIAEQAAFNPRPPPAVDVDAAGMTAEDRHLARQAKRQDAIHAEKRRERELLEDATRSDAKHYSMARMRDQSRDADHRAEAYEEYLDRQWRADQEAENFRRSARYPRTAGRPSAGEVAEFVLGVLPGSGELIDGHDCFVKDSTVSCAAMVVPIVPGRPIKKVVEAAADGRKLARAGDLIDLSSHARRRHILDGEVSPNGSFGGGHRFGTGFPGKSEFPAGWTDDQVMHNISDVATDSSLAVRPGDRPGDYFVNGTRSGVDIEVLIRNGEIWTGYPTNLPRNP